jgi:hypothetical protein
MKTRAIDIRAFEIASVAVVTHARHQILDPGAADRGEGIAVVVLPSLRKRRR